VKLDFRSSIILQCAALLCAVPAPCKAQTALSFDTYRERVEPIFLKKRAGHGPGLSPCAACHAHSGTPLRLEDLEEGENGRVHWSEAASRRNFAVVSRLVVPGSPEHSRLLRKPLAVSAGGVAFHVGGKFWQSQSDPEWQIIADWIRAATVRGATTEAAGRGLDFEFFRTCVQKLFLSKRPGLVECIHCHNVEPRNFAPPIPAGRDFWNLEESQQNFVVVRQYVEPGFPLMSRLLLHPLSPKAGGDHMHAGGRRWQSQDDPEWRMLAAWVRGERPACVIG
jgi:mono/diheme cytochrome c family protein